MLSARERAGRRQGAPGDPVALLRLQTRGADPSGRHSWSRRGPSCFRLCAESTRGRCAGRCDGCPATRVLQVADRSRLQRGARWAARAGNRAVGRGGLDCAAGTRVDGRNTSMDKTNPLGTIECKLGRGWGCLRAQKRTQHNPLQAGGRSTQQLAAGTSSLPVVSSRQWIRPNAPLPRPLPAAAGAAAERPAEAGCGLRQQRRLPPSSSGARRMQAVLDALAGLRSLTDLKLPFAPQGSQLTIPDWPHLTLLEGRSFGTTAPMPRPTPSACRLTTAARCGSWTCRACCCLQAATSCRPCHALCSASCA
jgi:hypothetical protein